MRQLKITKQITNRENLSLEKYLQEIAKVALITAEEEVNLAKRIRDGDRIALEKLTKANLRFVVSVAKQYQNRGLSLNDLINEGNVGLIKAGSRFDETRGFKFISYAVWWIRQSIIYALAEQARVVRLPLNRVGDISRISKAYAALEQNLQRDPTSVELAENLNTTAEFINDNMMVSQRSISADAPLGFEDNNTLMDTLTDANAVTPDSSLLDDAMKSDIREVLSTLSAREKEIMVLYYGLNDEQPLSLEDIGAKFSLTRERVRQIKEKATRRIRGSREAARLKEYLGS
jgi:RNA polymerase primary sigma factor